MLGARCLLRTSGRRPTYTSSTACTALPTSVVATDNRPEGILHAPALPCVPRGGAGVRDRDARASPCPTTAANAAGATPNTTVPITVHGTGALSMLSALATCHRALLDPHRGWFGVSGAPSTCSQRRRRFAPLPSQPRCGVWAGAGERHRSSLWRPPHASAPVCSSSQWSAATALRTAHGQLPPLTTRCVAPTRGSRGRVCTHFHR
jgi:hypothetical protein